MNEPVDLQSMDEAQMRQMLQHLMSELKHKQTLLDKLSYEMAILKRLKFAAKTEALNADQRSLLEDALEEDLQAVDEEIEQLRSAEERSPRQQPSCGVQLQPLVDALRQEVLAHSIVHADETPVQMLKRGSERDGSKRPAIPS